MTKYILIGGYPYKAKDGGKALCEEIINGFSEPVNVLICIFARPGKNWDKLYIENINFFKKNLPNIELIFSLANEHNFINQIENTNILNFNGGDTAELINKLKKNPEWLKRLDGKTIVGSSAGADILSTYNYDLEHFKCSHGFGLVPIKTIVHYEAANYTPPVGWKVAYEKLKRYKEDIPVIMLHEGEFRVFHI